MIPGRFELAIGFLLAVGAAAYLPFAEVQDLNPRSLHDFCEEGSGHRYCEGNHHKTLEDGGTVSLNWAMHTDPDRILSLDTELKHGVRVVKCTPSSLELELPESHARHLREGEMIVGSHFVHGCEHLMQRSQQEIVDDEPVHNNLYHEVTKVVRTEWRNADGSLAAGSPKGKIALAKVWTKEHESMENLIGLVAYDFDYTPVEATNVGPFPERRTCDTEWCNGEFRNGEDSERSEESRHKNYVCSENLQGGEELVCSEDGVPVSARRLQSPVAQNAAPQSFDANDFTKPQDSYRGQANQPWRDFKYRVDSGAPLFGGTTVTSNDVKSLMNLKPKNIANFAWNWDFKANASQDITLNYTVPGNDFYLTLTKPIIMLHSKIRFRLRSYLPHQNVQDNFFDNNQWVSLKKHMSNQRADIFEQWVPRVKWELDMDGHGHIDAGLMTQMNFRYDTRSNPLELIKIPVLQDFWKPQWFGSVNFPLGNIPVTLSPGFQFKAKVFHYGGFRGSLKMKLRTNPVYKPKLQFDSFTGVRFDLDTDLKEFHITPPNWMVSTSHFETGIALEPTIWIKGSFNQATTSLNSTTTTTTTTTTLASGGRRLLVASTPLLEQTIKAAQLAILKPKTSKFGASLRPYFNMTITRAGHVSTPSDLQKELVIYPFRIINLPTGSNYDGSSATGGKLYTWKLRIDTWMEAPYCRDTVNTGENTVTNGNPNDDNTANNGNPAGSNYMAYHSHGNTQPECEQYKRRMYSSDGLNIGGEISLHEAVSKFSWGMIAQRMLMHLQVEVRLIQVDNTNMDGNGKPLELLSDPVKITCGTIVNGVCQPSPMEVGLNFASIGAGGRRLTDDTEAKVYVHMLWQDEPQTWFNTRIRGVAASFPEVIINKDYVQQIVPNYTIDSYVNKGEVTGFNGNHPFVLAFIHGFKSYPLYLDKHNGFVPGINSSSLTSDYVLELGPNFLSSWNRVCKNGVRNCDPAVKLYYGDREIAKAVLPEIINWNTASHARSSTLQDLFGDEVQTSRIVPVSMALNPTYQNDEHTEWRHVGLVRIKMAIADAAGWNRFLSPYAPTAVRSGAAFRLIWALEGDQTQAVKFNIVVKKSTMGGEAGNVLTNSGTRLMLNSSTAQYTSPEYLRGRLGDARLDTVQVEKDILITPIHNDVAGFKRSRFEHVVTFGSNMNGLAVNDYVVVAVEWTDSFGNHHIMDAPTFVIAPETSANSSVLAAGGPNTGGRRLAEDAVVINTRLAEKDLFSPEAVSTEQEAGALVSSESSEKRFLGERRLQQAIHSPWVRGADGTWTHPHHGNLGIHENWQNTRECEQRDLNFEFGAGLMFRVFVEHLSLPSEIPVLGAIQHAPQIGTPWEEITAWRSSPTDLASKLPALLCRHGVCSATLPGCPAYQRIEKYWPLVKIQFAHTLPYPARTGNIKKDQWVDALKGVLSYAFAVLPEGMTIATHYINQTHFPGTVNPVNPSGSVNINDNGVTATSAGAPHRRRYQQFHNVMLAHDACEGHSYTNAQCVEVGCCQYHADLAECHANSPNHECLTPGMDANGNPIVAAPAGIAAAARNGVVAPITNAQAATAAATAPAVVSTAATAATAAAAATGSNLPPTVAPEAIIPTIGGRRLLAKDEDDEEDAENGVDGITIEFPHGLRYELDDKLMHALYHEGLFKDFEDMKAPHGDKQVRIHSWTIEDARPAEKYAQEGKVAGASTLPLHASILAGIAGCALLSVAFVVHRRLRGGQYEHVQESMGPVE
jgi:hypothetical protein